MLSVKPYLRVLFLIIAAGLPETVFPQACPTSPVVNLITCNTSAFIGTTCGPITATPNMVWPGKAMEVSGSGWTCPSDTTIPYINLPISCIYAYTSGNIPYPGSAASNFFQGSQLQPNYVSPPVVACYVNPNNGCLEAQMQIRIDAYEAANCPDPPCYIARAGYKIVNWPCNPNPPIVLYQPANGAILDYKCTTQITGKRFWPTSENTVTINLDGNISTVPVDGAGNFSLTANIVTGSHVVTASNSQSSATHNFTSNCKSIEFAIPQGQNSTRVLINDYGPQPQSYPSPYQIEDGKIKIQVTAKKDLQLAVGENVYFRLVNPDPADSSPYLSGTQPGDNVGQLSTLSTSMATSDGNGIAETTLILPSDARPGDNYQVEAAFQDLNSNPPYKVTSGIVTAWRRVYVEQDNMVMKGGLLTVSAKHGDNSVVVYDWATLPTCTNLAPPWSKGKTPTPCYQISVFDSTQPYAATLDQPYVGWTTRVNNTLVLNLTDANINNRYTLKSDYGASPYPSFFPINPISGDSAAVALLGTGLYTADIIKLDYPFNDGYVEFKPVSIGVGEIPYLPPSFFSGARMAAGGTCQNPIIEAVPGYDRLPFRRFAWIWFTHAGVINHIWVSGAGASDQLGTCTVCQRGNKSNPLPQYFGRASVEQKIAYIMRGSIQAVCPGNQETNSVRDTTNHETGHIFGRVPIFGTPDTAHDTWCEWTFDGPKSCADAVTTCANPLNNACLMNVAGSSFNKLHRFDRLDLACGDESIRRQSDLQGVIP